MPLPTPITDPREALDAVAGLLKAHLVNALQGNMTLSEDALNDLSAYAARMAPLAAEHAAAYATAIDDAGRERALHYLKGLRDLARSRAERWGRLGIRKNRNLIADTVLLVVEGLIMFAGMGPAALAGLLTSRAIAGLTPDPEEENPGS
jgi:hypothetical protein